MCKCSDKEKAAGRKEGRKKRKKGEVKKRVDSLMKSSRMKEYGGKGTKRYITTQGSRD